MSQIPPLGPNLEAPYIDARDRLLALVDGLTFEDFNHKPAPSAWSAGECVVHLNKIAKGYLPLFEEAAARDAPAGAPPFRYGWLSRRFVETLRPGTRPVPTASALKPPPVEGLVSQIDPDRSIERFLGDTERYLAVIREAEGLDLAAIKIRSPFLPILRLPFGAFLEAMGLHNVRHVMQAERAAATAGGR